MRSVPVLFGSGKRGEIDAGGDSSFNSATC